MTGRGLGKGAGHGEVQRGRTRESLGRPGQMGEGKVMGLRALGEPRGRGGEWWANMRERMGRLVEEPPPGSRT